MYICMVFIIKIILHLCILSGIWLNLYLELRCFFLDRVILVREGFPNWVLGHLLVLHLVAIIILPRYLKI